MGKKKGGHARRAGKRRDEENERALLFREIGQEYGQITKMLGDRRVTVRCFDGKTRQCKVRGKMRKRVWVAVGDIVLVSLRDFQDDKGDVVHRYNTTEARNLVIYKELPDDTTVGVLATDASSKATDDCVFDFDAI